MLGERQAIDTLVEAADMEIRVIDLPQYKIDNQKDDTNNVVGVQDNVDNVSLLKEDPKSINGKNKVEHVILLTTEQIQVSQTICPLEHFTPRETNGPNKGTCHCILEDMENTMSSSWKGTLDFHSSKCQGNVSGGKYHSTGCLMGTHETFLTGVRYCDVHYCSCCRIDKRDNTTLWCRFCFAELKSDLLPKRQSASRVV